MPPTPTPNVYLSDRVRERVESIPRKKCEEWGGTWNEEQEVSEVTPVVDTGAYRDRTVVRSANDAGDAFKKYTDWHRYVTDDCTPTSETAVLLPCGAQKPIGSSSIHKKKVSAIKQSPLADSDIVIVSEPCTVVPHWMRLALAPVNYDFPPEYTEPGTAPTVFDAFATRVAEWLEVWDYDTVYAYLPQGHWDVVSEALEITLWDGDVFRVPGASYNPDTESYSGDLFKTTRDVAVKLRAVATMTKDSDTIEQRVDDCDGSAIADSYRFYDDRFSVSDFRY